MKVGHSIDVERGSWTFEGNVARHFLDHVRRSVPMYDQGHDLICQVSDHFCHADSVCYELGVSTGQLVRKLAEYQAHKPGARWIGIDKVEDMVIAAMDHCSGVPNVDIVLDDVLIHPFEKTDLIVSYYCVQFIEPRHRQELIDRLYERLNWGGGFILFEKVRAPDARFQDLTTGLYNDFKAANGFTAEEILNKTASLKGVLEPFSTEGNLAMLRRAGFTDITTVMKYVCFEGFLAIK